MREVADVAAIGDELAALAQIFDPSLVEFVGDLASQVPFFGVLIADLDVAVGLRLEDADRVAQRGRVAAQIGVDVVERRVAVSFKEGQELRLAFRHHGLHGLARAVQDGVASKSRNSFDASHTCADMPTRAAGLRSP